MSVARHGARVFAATWLAFPLQFATSIVVVRALGAEGKGVLVLLTGAVAILAMVAQFGLPAAGVFLLRRGAYPPRTLFLHHACIVLLASIAAGLAVLLGLPLFARAFLDGRLPSTASVLTSIAAFPFVMSYGFVSTLLLASGQSVWYARLTVAGSIATLLLTLSLVIVFNLGLLGALLAVVLPQAATAWVAAALLIRNDREKPRLQASLFIEMFRFGSGHYMGTLGSQMFKRLDSFLVGYFLNPAAVGYYSIALTAYEGLLSIPRAFSSIVSGEATARGTQQGASLVARATRTLTWTMGLVAVVIAIASYWVVPFIYGADFIRAVRPLQILAVAGIGVGAAVVLQSYFLGVGRPQIGGALTLFAGVVNVLLSLWLIPRYGIVGNAIATAAAAFGSALLHLIWFSRISGCSFGSAIVPQQRDLDVFGSLARGLRTRTTLHSEPSNFASVEKGSSH